MHFRESHALFAALCAATCPVALAFWAEPANAEDYVFKVFCNGSPVGYHEVHVRHKEDETDVDIDSQIDVTLAGLARISHRK